MVEIKKDGDNFVFDIEGSHKLWALKSSLTVPAEHIDKAYPNTEGLHVKLGLRFPGTNVPGIIDAGSFYGKNGVIFCDITRHSKSIVVEVEHEKYDKIIVDVEDPEEAINLLTKQ